MIRFLTSGESHGKVLVGIIEGVPAGLEISKEYIDNELKRRQTGYGRGERMKIESDEVEILSGIRLGKTIGSPIALLIKNRDWKNWEEKMSIEKIDKEISPITMPRPGHADLVGVLKYGFDDIRNVIERSSARETTTRVAIGAIAKRFLEELNIKIFSHVIQIGKIKAPFSAVNNKLPKKDLKKIADSSPVRCLDKSAEKKIIALIDKAKSLGNTLGGIFEVVVTGLPVGLGSYVHWDRKLDGRLAQAIMSINAVKGVEIGLGFKGAKMFGSELHDEIFIRNGKFYHKTNHSGGTEGGVTNGEPLVIRGAMKPISTLLKPLRSVDIKTKKSKISRYERSDVCAVPACAVISEAMVAIILSEAITEKFGGDSIKEIKYNINSYQKSLTNR
jgi:chorismate synthase